MKPLDIVNRITERVIDLSLQGKFDSIIIYRTDLLHWDGIQIAVFESGEDGECEVFSLPVIPTKHNPLNGQWCHGKALIALKCLEIIASEQSDNEAA